MIFSNVVFKIIPIASISINVSYTMCYTVGNYIGTLAANCTDKSLIKKLFN